MAKATVQEEAVLRQKIRHVRLVASALSEMQEEINNLPLEPEVVQRLQIQLRTLRETVAIALNYKVANQDRSGDPLVFAIENAAVMGEQVQRLMEELRCEPHTKLLSAGQFDKELVRVIASEEGPRHITVGFMDLRDLKKFNTEYGHSIGSLTIQAVAERLQKHFRKGTFLARFGGDEFVVLLPHCNDVGIRIIAKRIVEEMTSPVERSDDPNLYPAPCLDMGFVSVDLPSLRERGPQLAREVFSAAEGLMKEVKAASKRPPLETRSSFKVQRYIVKDRQLKAVPESRRVRKGDILLEE